MSTLLLSLTWGDVAANAVDFFGFRYDFAVRALLAAAFVGLLSGVVGVFLVLRGMSLLGDAVGHATLPGVCAGFLLTGTKSSWALLAGALIAGLASAALTGHLGSGRRTRPDAAVAIVMSVFYGAGIVLLSIAQNSPAGSQSGLDDFLFGNPAAVSPGEVAILGTLAALLCIAVVVFWRPLALCTFDAEFAVAAGLRPDRWQLALTTTLGVAVVLSIRSVGVVLVSALLVIPASAALLVARRLGSVVAVSSAIGVLSGCVGAFASYLAPGVSSGPAMVVVAAVLFGAALALRTLRRQQWGAAVEIGSGSKT